MIIVKAGAINEVLFSFSLQFALCDFLREEHLGVDIDAIEDLSVALEKLDEVHRQLEGIEIEDDEQFGKEGFWESLLEKCFEDYSMQYFLRADFEEDEEIDRRCRLLYELVNGKEHLIDYDSLDMSMTKLEDLNNIIRKRMASS